MVISVVIPFQALVRSILVLLGNKVKVPLAKELNKQASRVDGLKVQDMVRQGDKAESLCRGWTNQLCVDGLRIESEESFHILKVAEEDML